MQPRDFLTKAFEHAVAAADPLEALRAHLPEKPKGRVIVIGAGKGAAQMAQALEQLWTGPLEGSVVTRYGHGVACKYIEVLEASHPVPDAAGLDATARLQARVRGLGPDDLVIALICGGGSALLPAPPKGFDLADEVALNQRLLDSGAPISVMNAIRRQFSTIKGGRLAALAAPARVVTLVVSDIPGDIAADVASGPTLPAEGSGAEAVALADAYQIALEPSWRAHMLQERAPQPGDAVFAGHGLRVIASNARSLEAAASYARRQGVDPIILSDAVEGEAAEAGRFHAAIALEVARRDRPFTKPCVLLSGGETTVTIGQKSAGKGGRNTAFMMGFAAKIGGIQGIHALAADTDGIDGIGSHAGAFGDGGSVARLLAQARRPEESLRGNDTGGAFEASGDLFVTGPTGTNVNDFRAILIR